MKECVDGLDTGYVKAPPLSSPVAEQRSERAQTGVWERRRLVPQSSFAPRLQRHSVCGTFEVSCDGGSPDFWGKTVTTGLPRRCPSPPSSIHDGRHPSLPFILF
uniref:Uncharacterized protein n=1 Tax=Chromera velia CCMP2878 TaxID=1169474 RepID=A0A0G4F459_9ALVE|eukprot:Cvel_15003.t1-p1 / transcript=Cvel_15003.t1 / gene=Cvel_15003 / organism=Chromera_velia_CCMP2878 / gene_product=hypothetical protein / transcript_product=hypothetical protein / location=Cvel_scaffold1091:46174-46482(-) / protein_length=103 / sequence_SO=supercontig / SO=protein_coding / is_pseudo=false